MLKLIEKNKIAEDLKRISLVFKNDKVCMQFLYNQKWSSGFVCPKCGNVNFCKGKKEYTRRCTRCKKEISPTTHTLFHRCKLPLKKAFEIVYLSCKYPDISSYEMSKIMGIRRMTCYHFQKKAKNCNANKADVLLLKKIKEHIENSEEKP